MVFSLETSNRFGRRFRGIGKLLRGLSPSLDTELIRADMAINADSYRFNSIFSAIFFACIIFSILFAVIFSMTEDIDRALLIGTVGGSVLFVLVLFVLLNYPKIIAGKESEILDKDLVYALKDLLLSVSSGLSLFTAMTLVSTGKYGYVSRDIKRIVDRVNRGVPLDDAIEELAIKTPSEHFQNALWQLVNTAKSGANIEGVLRSLIDNLVSEQRSSIQKYSNELNVLTLIYMLAAVAIPTIIITLMIILNAFVLADITDVLLILFIVGSLFVQVAIIGFVKSRRPLVHV